MDQLTELAIKYKADKWGKHHYTTVYFDLFKDPGIVSKVVEIGTGEGASIAMWNDFFPNAKIFGADIDPKRVTLPPTYPRITIAKCDQTSEDDIIELLNLTGPDVDLFIDDGSHKPEDQLFTCLQVVPALDKKAIYVIEDVADPDIFLGLPTRWDVDMRKLGDRYDDRLISVRKNYD